MKKVAVGGDYSVAVGGGGWRLAVRETSKVCAGLRAATFEVWRPEAGKPRPATLHNRLLATVFPMPKCVFVEMYHNSLVFKIIMIYKKSPYSFEREPIFLFLHEN